jgi:site-specific recombinase XerC
MALADRIAALDQLLNQIRQAKIKKIQGCVLAMALELIYKSGLQKNEVPKIRIKNIIFDANREPSTINIPSDQTSIPLADEVKKPLQRYLAYLQITAQYSPESPLFPGYGYEEKINQHLEKFSSDIDIHEIHEVGVKRLYNRLRYQGKSKPASLTDTTNQFRIKKRSVKQSVKDKIQKPGKPALIPNEKEREVLHGLIEDILFLKSENDAVELCRKFSEIIAKTRLYHLKQKFGIRATVLQMLREKRRAIRKQAAVKNVPKKEPVKMLSEILKEWNPKK